MVERVNPPDQLHAVNTLESISHEHRIAMSSAPKRFSRPLAIGFTTIGMVALLITALPSIPLGGSAGAARNLGVPVARVKITLFAFTAFSAAILASIQSMVFSSADILRGTNLELDAITTAVIGGSLLTGGYGSVVGAAFGALALGMARQGIVFADINADWYKIAIGTLLLVAVVLNNWIRRRFAGLR